MLCPYYAETCGSRSRILCDAAHDRIVEHRNRAGNRVWSAQTQLQRARSPAKVLLHPTAGHGGFIADPAYQQHIVDEFAGLVLASEGRL